MRKPFFKKILLVVALFLGVNTFANEAAEEGKKDTKSEIKEFIEHHLQDSHYFNFFSSTDNDGVVHHYGFPLPVILWDNGLQMFSSSKFHHGESIAEVNGNYYKLFHGKIYRTDAQGTIELGENHHPTNIRPLDFSITKSVVMMLVTGLLM